MHRVAVIGSGASGLAALRHLAAKPELYTPVCYEQADEVGGQWVYREEVGHDNKGKYIFSSMYQSCSTNLPKELFQYADFPFAEHLPSSVPHADMRNYLEDFADHFQLKKYIRFNTLVTKVSPLTTEAESVKWEIATKNASDQIMSNASFEEFDFVFVCNGIYSFPYTPEIPGMNLFQGTVIHSHDYRVPEVFKDMRVVTLGRNASAQDISLEVAKVAKEVIISHKGDRLNIPSLPNMRQTGIIQRVTESEAIFEDGEKFEMDALIICSGYRKEFPFLASECNTRVDGYDVYPLYKHILHTEFSSLAFIGMMDITKGFQHAEEQVKFAMSAWEGVQKLPTREEMEADIRREQEWRVSIGYPAHRPHFLGSLARRYGNEIARLGGFKTASDNDYGAFELIVKFWFEGYLEYMNLRALPKTATGEYDLEKFATFPCYVEKLRRGDIDDLTPTFQFI